MKKLLLLACLLPSFMSSFAQTTLKSGSIVTLRFAEEVKSNSNVANVVVANNVKVGDKYKDYPAVVSRIDYKSKKWWQFWKKKEIIGYQVMWVGDENEPSYDVKVIENINSFM